MIEFSKTELIVLDDLICDAINNDAQENEVLLYSMSEKINDELSNIDYKEIGA